MKRLIAVYAVVLFVTISGASTVYLKMKENLHLAKRGAPSGFRGYRR